MTEFIVLILYVWGVYTAYFQLQKWAEHKPISEEEYQTLFTLSLLSWLVYPLYGIIYLFKECEGD